MAKYIIHIDPDDPEDIDVELDDPEYDGPISLVGDAYGTYHIDAESEESAIAAAKWEFIVDDGIPTATDDYDGF